MEAMPPLKLNRLGSLYLKTINITRRKMTKSTINKPNMMPASVSPDKLKYSDNLKSPLMTDLIPPGSLPLTCFFKTTSRVTFLATVPALFVTLHRYLDLGQEEGEKIEKVSWKFLKMKDKKRKVLSLD